MAEDFQYAGKYLSSHLFRMDGVDFGRIKPESDLGIVVTIPCFDEPDLLNSLESLFNCEAPESATEVVVVVNYPENADKDTIARNMKTYHDALHWSETHSRRGFHLEAVLAPNLPLRHAGVGLARKIAMDMAVEAFHSLDRPDGIITGFDADSTCRKDYLRAIESHFWRNPKTPGASILYEHPLDNEAICRYELHLRYVVEAERAIGFPYAFHTIGSSFAVRASAYVKQGGMNRRKAGEDFYFLNKIMALGNYSQIKTTTMYPSSRSSHRVPFGTGASIARWNSEGATALYSYRWEVFLMLKELFDRVGLLYRNTDRCAELLDSLPQQLRDYLLRNGFRDEIQRIDHHSASMESFIKGFFAWMDGFRIVKFLNYVHTSSMTRNDVVPEAIKCLKYLGVNPSSDSPEVILRCFRFLQA